MKLPSSFLRHGLAGILVAALAASPQFVLGQSSPAPQQEQQKTASPPAQPEAGSPGQTGEQTQSNPPEQKPLPDSPGQVQSQPAAAQQSPGATERPLGTAAAEIGNASGSAASKPAGVAIAPAKTHSSRSLLIKVGAVLGAAVALGTVMALSNSSPSRPPGATGASTPLR